MRAMSASRQHNLILLVSVLVIAVCGLVYELLAGALSSYLVGSSVTQFSLVIGLFMFAMGIGSYLSRFVARPLHAFVAIEIAVGVAGGCSGLLLFWAFTFLGSHLPWLVLSTLSVGTLVGLEIPLVMRALKEREALERAVSSVLALDYVGALLASLLFPLLLSTTTLLLTLLVWWRATRQPTPGEAPLGAGAEVAHG